LSLPLLRHFSSSFDYYADSRAAIITLLLLHMLRHSYFTPCLITPFFRYYAIIFFHAKMPLSSM